MASGRQRYRRLQVENVWVRMAFELLAIIFAITFCCVTIVSAYEATYSEATQSNTIDYAMQLGHSVSGLVGREAVEESDETRFDYLAERYSADLESCFISGSTMNTGAVYIMKDGEPVLYAASERYAEVLADAGLLDAETGASGEELDAALRNVFAGGESVLGERPLCVALVPMTDGASALPYAVTAVSVAFRDSFDYDSAVRGRIILISIVVCLLLVAYYCASAAITDRNRIKEKAVSEQ